MKSNVLLRWGIPLVLGGVLLLVLKPFGGNAPTSGSQDNDPDTRLTAAEAKSLGIGDTPQDTVATLVGQVKAMRNELQTQLKTNQELREENRRLRERESSVDSRINSALNSVTQKASEERRQAEATRQKSEDETKKARELLGQLQGQLASLAGKEELPVGLGLEPGDGQQFDGAPLEGSGLVWIEPADHHAFAGQKERQDKASGFSLPGSLPSLDDTPLDRGQKELRAVAKSERALAGNGGRTEGANPVYTVPQNATLMGSVAMTALIGRIPVDGTVNDPYPFKVLIGPDNLTANGIDLPEVVGAVASGTASGDWTLSCVRGQIESLTFVFQDGTIRTVPEPQKVTRNRSSTPNSQAEKIRGGLGYLSDPYGIPCISGERRSNAQQYLGSQSLITAAGAGMASLLDNDDSRSGNVISSSGTAIGIDGGGGNRAMDSILSGGVSDIREWINKLYGEAFAAVYVKPAAQVAVHIDQELTIDYEPKGRKVNHEIARLHSTDLD